MVVRDLVQNVICIAPDHIDVDVKYDLAARHGRMSNEFTRPGTAAFLGIERDEYDRILGLMSFEIFCNGKQSCCPRCIVVCAIEDLAIYDPEVVVMRRNDDMFL